MDWHLWLAAYLFVGLIIGFIVLWLEGGNPEDGILMIACLTGWPFILLAYLKMAVGYWIIDPICFLIQRARRGG